MTEVGTRDDGVEETAAKLLGANGLSPDVFWIEGLCRIADDEPWRMFLRHFAQVARAYPPDERPCFVLPVQDTSRRFADIEDIGLRRRDWQGAVTALDVALFAAERIALRPHPAAIAARDLVAHLVAELSVGDLELAETLVTLLVELLLEPLPALVRLGETFWGLAPGRCANNGPSAGVPMLIWAALRGDTRLIKRALWRAQTRVLFPIIEERRFMLVEARPAWLKPPYPLRNGETIVDPLDLELSHLLHLLRRTSPSHPLVQELGTLTRIRNDLAHLRPCPATLLGRAEIRPLLDLAALR